MNISTTTITLTKVSSYPKISVSSMESNVNKNFQAFKIESLSAIESSQF